MEISYVGHSILDPPTSEMHLNNILHVPKASKNLIFINHLARDNNAFLEFHPNHFFILIIFFHQGTRVSVRKVTNK